MSSPIYQAIKQISDEKNIPIESVVETIEAALASAYAKDFGDKKTQNIKVKFEAESGAFEVFDVKTVVEDQELPPEETEEEILARLEKEKQERLNAPPPVLAENAQPMPAEEGK